MMSAITQSLSPASGRLRPFEASRDLNAVADLVEQCFADTLDKDGRRYIDQMHSAARNPRLLRLAAMVGNRAPLPLNGYVWEEGGRIVGNLSLIPFINQGQRLYLIANVAVEPHYRRRGIARALTRTAIEHARQRGGRGVWLHVREENDAAFRLYYSLGFRERARRTTWESRATQRGASDLPQAGLADPGQAGTTRVNAPRASDWPLQRAWLSQAYPPEISWHLPFNLNALRLDLWGGLYRLMTGAAVVQWAALSNERLLGVMSWQLVQGRLDYLWLAADPLHVDQAVRALAPSVRRYFSNHRSFVLDYPAGRAVEALQENGFQIHQTLIWMGIPFN
jgi:ribosomal protein S18 acetylase RimI-like enzyme